MVRQWMAETYLEPPDFKLKNLISEGDKLAELRAFVIRPTIPE